MTGSRKAEVQTGIFEYPRSMYHGWNPPYPVTEEGQALRELKPLWESVKDPDDKDMVVELNDFTIACDISDEKFAYELRPLSFLSKQVGNKLMFSGIISFGNEARFFIEDAPITEFSIEGYGDDEDPNVTIYVQTLSATPHGWYKLQSAAIEYQAHHKPFVWLATFAKHVMDYLMACEPQMVTLKHFKRKFSLWIRDRYPGNPDLERWLSAAGTKDFRQAVNAHADLLYHQASNLDELAPLLLPHPVWADCLRRGHSVPRQEERQEKTIATPIVYTCFRDLYFGRFMQQLNPHPTLQEEMKRREKRLGFRPRRQEQTGQVNTFPGVCVGDVVGLVPEAGSDWKGQEEWMGYVHRTEHTRAGLRLYLIWLYRPAETTIANAGYPYEDELFFSDHCNCDTAAIHAREVKNKYTVRFGMRRQGGHSTDFFIRQRYLIAENAFVTFNDAPSTCECECSKSNSRRFEPGETIYLKDQNVLEPVIYIRSINDGRAAVVRQLLRLHEHPELQKGSQRKHIPTNELVWTEQVITIPVRRLGREYHLRMYSPEDIEVGEVPIPYNRSGTGDCWILSSRLVYEQGQGKASPFSLSHLGPNSFREGFNPVRKGEPQPLRGLSVFSGGGNLDRGLEEGGGVRFETAIDIEAPAIHTQKANGRSNLKLYFGSVNDYLREILTGRERNFDYARVGEVDFIAGGSPCPPFSLMTQNRRSEKLCQRASLLAAFCTLVDIYRPKYALMENVVNMACQRQTADGKETNVFPTLVACFVALGYQTRQFMIDSWSHGSGQQRTRLFLSIAAPSLSPILCPPLTHSHPPKTLARSISVLSSNSVRYGERDLTCPTPFTFGSAIDIMDGLPNAASGGLPICIPFADHRLLRPLDWNNRSLIRHIPRSPEGWGLRETIRAGIEIPVTVRKAEIGSSYKRIKGTGLVPTIVTKPAATNSRGGAILHWQEHRVLTIQEARRTQGFPDHEVIIGSPEQQWHVIGNAVDRSVAIALGLQLRKAWDISRHKRRTSLSAVHETPMEATRASRESIEIIEIMDSPVTESTSQAVRDSSESIEVIEVMDSPMTEPMTEPITAPIEESSLKEMRKGTERMCFRTASRSFKRRLNTDDLSSGSSTPRKRTRLHCPTPEFAPTDWSKTVEKDTPQNL